MFSYNHKFLDRIFSDYPLWSTEIPFSQTTKNYKVEETKDNMKIRIDVPGVTKDDLKVELNDENVLFIVWKRDNINKDLAFKLNNSLNLDSIESFLENGVLEILIKKDKKLKRNIEIKVKT